MAGRRPARRGTATATSRRRASRVVLRGSSRAAIAGFFFEEATEPLQPAPEVVRRQREAQADVAGHAQLVAGGEQHGVAFAQLGDERAAVQVREVEAEARDRRGVVRRERQLAAGARDPVLQHGVALADEAPRAADDAVADGRRQRVGRHVVRDRRGAQAGVLAAGPHLVDGARVADGPADPQARQAVGLAGAAGGHHLVVRVEEARRKGLAAALAAAVDLVGEDPRRHPVGLGDHGGHLVGRQRSARGVVGVADGDRFVQSVTCSRSTSRSGAKPRSGSSGNSLTSSP